MISLVCHVCKRLVDVPGMPCTYADVWNAARAHGWTVEARRVCCPSCRERASSSPRAVVAGGSGE